MDITESNQGKDNREHLLGTGVRNQANTYLNQNPKSVAEKQPAGPISESSKELDVLYRQISECLEQWPAKKSQNYFELKHHFDLLHILRNEQYKGKAFAFILKTVWRVESFSRKPSCNGCNKECISMFSIHKLFYDLTKN